MFLIHLFFYAVFTVSEIHEVGGGGGGGGKLK